MRFWALGLVPVLVCSVLGCSVGRGEPSLVSDDPALKVPAIKRAGDHAAKGTEKDIPHLIDELENTDPAIRMFAIRTLERLTGQTRGYQYYGAEPGRAVAVRAWRAAYGLPLGPPRTLSTTKPAATTAPSTAPSVALANSLGGGGGGAGGEG